MYPAVSDYCSCPAFKRFQQCWAWNSAWLRCAPGSVHECRVMPQSSAEVVVPLQVAKELVGLHHQLAQNELALLNTLRAAAPSGASSSQRQHVWTLTSCSLCNIAIRHSMHASVLKGHDLQTMCILQINPDISSLTACVLQLDRDGTVLQGGDESSSDSGDEDMPDSATEMEVEAAPKVVPQQPVVDADGFELVQNRRRR